MQLFVVLLVCLNINKTLLINHCFPLKCLTTDGAIWGLDPLYQLTKNIVCSKWLCVCFSSSERQSLNVDAKLTAHGAVKLLSIIIGQYYNGLLGSYILLFRYYLSGFTLDLNITYNSNYRILSQQLIYKCMEAYNSFAIYQLLARS